MDDIAGRLLSRRMEAILRTQRPHQFSARVRGGTLRRVMLSQHRSTVSRRWRTVLRIKRVIRLAAARAAGG